MNQKKSKQIIKKYIGTTEIGTITGEILYSTTQVPTYKAKDVIAVLKIVNK